MVDGITGSTASVATTEGRGKLQRATEDFEAMLLADLLKSGPKMGTVDGNEEDDGAGRYGDFSTEAMASAMAKQGGVGIGRMLLKQLGPAVRGADIKGFSSSADTLIAGEYSDEVEK